MLPLQLHLVPNNFHFYMKKSAVVHLLDTNNLLVLKFVLNTPWICRLLLLITLKKKKINSSISQFSWKFCEYDYFVHSFIGLRLIFTQPLISVYLVLQDPWIRWNMSNKTFFSWSILFCSLCYWNKRFILFFSISICFTSQLVWVSTVFYLKTYIYFPKA